MARSKVLFNMAVAATVMAGCGLAPASQIRTPGSAEVRAFARTAAADIARQTGADAAEIEEYIESQAAELTAHAKERVAFPTGGQSGQGAGPGALTLPPSAPAAPSSIEALINADRIFAAVEEAVRNAKHRIQMDVFLLGGRIGSRLAQTLVDRRKAGVDVRVVLDPHFAAMGPANQQMMATATFLRDHALPVRTFPLEQLLQPAGAIAKASLIDHNKIVIVDDVAFVGGANFIDVADTNHDLMFRIRGPIVAEVSQWVDATFDRSTYPAIWNTGKGTQAPPQLPTPTFRPTGALPEAPVARARLTRTDRTEHSTYDRLLTWIREASNIEFAVFELDDEQLKAELIAAKKRGATVRVLLDRHQLDYKYTGKKAPAGIPNWLAVRDLLAAGIPVRWYDSTLPMQEMHMKLALFDDNVAVVGSTNFTTRAFLHYRETGLEIEGGPAVKDLTTMFESDWADHSTGVDSLNSRQRALAATIAFLDRNGIGWW